MHRQFVRLFISITLIIILALLLLLGLLSLYGNYIVQKWTEEVFDEFALSLASNLDKVELSPSTLSIDLFNSDISERISGFIMRNVPTGQIITFGKSGKGITFTSSSLYPDNEEEETHTIYSISKSKYRIDVKTESSFNLKIKDVKMSETHNKGKTDVVFPSSVEKEDLAGSIDVYLNDELYSVLDVLVYSVDYYTPTRFVLTEVYSAIIFSIPLVLLFSLFFAYYVSSKSSKRVKEVESSLSSLSKGEYELNLSPSNISEYNRINDSIKSLGEDLKRHSRSRKEWIRNISHDLNTPVASINILLEGAEDGIFPLNKELITSIKSENDSLVERIKSISYYSYLLSPDLKCVKVRCNLLNIINSLTNNGDNIKMELSGEEEVFADYTLLERALEEVLKNAKEYGDGDIEIKYHSSTILISNSGRLPHPLPQFFEPWSRGDDSREKGGSGMGLPIVYQIMEAHEGRVSINEKDDKVEVSLVFPL